MSNRTYAVKIGQVAGHNNGGWCYMRRAYFFFGPWLTGIRQRPTLMSLQQATALEHYWKKDAGAKIEILSLQPEAGRQIALTPRAA